jgi:hypothetical protein
VRRYDRRDLSDALIPNTKRKRLGSLSKLLPKCVGVQTYFHHARSGWAAYACPFTLDQVRGPAGYKITGGGSWLERCGITLNFGLFDRFNGDIDAFAKHAGENGANVSGPVNQPWNVREVTVVDPDGYKLIFTVPINIDLRFDEMLEQATGSKIDE